jgi:hypothetical protein
VWVLAGLGGDLGVWWDPAAWSLEAVLGLLLPVGALLGLGLLAGGGWLLLDDLVVLGGGLVVCLFDPLVEAR